MKNLSGSGTSTAPGDSGVSGGSIAGEILKKRTEETSSNRNLNGHNGKPSHSFLSDDSSNYNTNESYLVNKPIQKKKAGFPINRNKNKAVGKKSVSFYSNGNGNPSYNDEVVEDIPSSQIIRGKNIQQKKAPQQNGGIERITDVGVPFLIDDHTKRRFAMKINYLDKNGRERKRVLKFGRKGKPERNPLTSQFMDNVLSYVLSKNFDSIHNDFRDTVLGAQSAM